MSETRRLQLWIFGASAALLLYELLLVRLFAVVMFADYAHLALALALLGIGVGAIAQHLRPSLVPAEGLGRRLASLTLLQALVTVVAVVAAVRFPVIRMWETVPLTYTDRAGIRGDLLDPAWFAALLPLLAAPFACAGLAIAGVFQRRKEHIGALYGADLLGAAAAALVFLPLLTTLAGPDVVFVVVLLAGAASLVVADRARERGLGAALVLAGGLGAAWATRADLIPIREAAGYSEVNVVYTRWTPLTRLAIHRDQRGDYMLLDNSSASEIVQAPARRQALRGEANRSLVYHLHDPPARVAVLAASAGPEVAVAQSFGFTGIDAIDIASEIFDEVAARYPTAPVNPYVHGDTRRVHADGRAAILGATEPYDIIQMVHANLWSSAGLMSNAWSPALLETREAFGAYLDHLAEDGTLSFGRGTQSDDIVRSAWAALSARGVAEPWRHLALVGGASRVVLVKKRPWTDADLVRLRAGLAATHRVELWHDPTGPGPSDRLKKVLTTGTVLTDDHPYSDRPGTFFATLGQALGEEDGSALSPLAVLYRSLFVQIVFALAAGALFLGVPWWVRGRGELAGVRGVGPLLLYVACLGYGYLAVETVLIHALVLFVGHPTYAVTTVVLAMLTGSGAGAWWAERVTGDRARRLVGLLAAVLGLGLIQAWGVPAVVHPLAQSWPIAVRVGLTGGLLLPLGFVMGTAFPLGIRALPPAAAPIIPWAWAINGWMSVIASLGTVLIARVFGYSVALAVALGAYAVAMGVAGRLGAKTPAP